MIRVSRLADYAVVLTTKMAILPNGSHATEHLSDLTGIPFSTTSKILTKLVHAKLVVSKRGIRGGYSLSRSAKDISVGHIISAIDGKVALTLCVENNDEKSSTCNLIGLCPSQANWKKINDEIELTLNNIKLSEMADNTNKIFIDSNFVKSTSQVGVKQ